MERVTSLRRRHQVVVHVFIEHFLFSVMHFEVSFFIKIHAAHIAEVFEQLLSPL